MQHLDPNVWKQWWTDATPLARQTTFPRLLVALVLGICIGTERQWRQRAAGLRTNTLVCLGAAAFVDLGLTIAPSTTQVVAYVVSGVGFLGAGAIMKDGGSVRGLNTAATLWCSAAVGACAGAGELLDAVFVATLLLSVNSLLRPLSRFIDRRSLAGFDEQTLYRLRVVCNADKQGATESLIRRVASGKPILLRELRVEQIEPTGTALIQVLFESETVNDKAMQAVSSEIGGSPEVESVDWSVSEAEVE